MRLFLFTYAHNGDNLHHNAGDNHKRSRDKPLKVKNLITEDLGVVTCAGVIAIFFDSFKFISFNLIIQFRFIQRDKFVDRKICARHTYNQSACDNYSDDSQQHTEGEHRKQLFKLTLEQE